MRSRCMNYDHLYTTSAIPTFSCPELVFNCPIGWLHSGAPGSWHRPPAAPGSRVRRLIPSWDRGNPTRRVPTCKYSKFMSRLKHPLRDLMHCCQTCVSVPKTASMLSSGSASSHPASKTCTKSTNRRSRPSSCLLRESAGLIPSEPIRCAASVPEQSSEQQQAAPASRGCNKDLL